MKKYYGILLLGGLILCSFGFQENKPKEQKKKVIYKGATFLAGGKYGEGKIPYRVFDSLMRTRLVSKDSSGNFHEVNSFTFTYAERGAFEDSTGTLKIMTDYYTAESENGLLPDYFIKSLKERVKYGDTVYYFDVMSRMNPDSTKTSYYSLPVKLILTK